VIGMLVNLASSTSWWSENKDLLALAVSLAALFWSVWSTNKTTKRSEAMTQRTLTNAETMNRQTCETSAALARTATFQRMHEMLVDPKAAKGRRLLFVAHRTGGYPSLGQDGWDDINYSLALYDTLGGYVQHGQVDPEIVFETWHHPLQNIAVPVQEFMAHRRGEDVRQPWAFLHELVRRAQAHHCTCPLAGFGDV
jgi:hypothetical protein